MATISLRAYIREIESLIDHNHTETAIAHCMHILQLMPKHIGTYRMLGKALHEAQRYADASDVFQRVLSSVPDDFVSNVGLSIIRQDEGNLDSAIWHMERAFESQPSNQAIQEELRRLYGRRDGIAPNRVRLTRGALSRMYMKGHLYNQAVGELRAALAEEPHRADLQVLLAQAAYQIGQKVEAVEVCSLLLKKYPYCLEANRLLALILPNTERAKDAEIYRQRVITLDPYLKKADPDTLIPETVPDAAVNVEKLEIIPGQETAKSGTSQPTWAASLGAPFETKEPTELPEWLHEEQSISPGNEIDQIHEQIPPAEPEGITWETSTGKLGTDWLKHYEPTEEEPQESQAPTDESPVPEWMRAAGWQSTEGGQKEAPVSWEEFEATSEGEIETGEIPDWLKAIAPSEPAPEEASAPNWLQENPPGASDTIVNWLNQTQGPAAEEDVSDFESALDQVITEKNQEQAESTEEVPDWLRGLEAQGPSEGPTTGELNIPAWLEQAEPEQPTQIEPTSAGSEWLKEIEAEATADSYPEITAEPAVPAVEAELPDWLKSIEPEEVTPEAEDSTEWFAGKSDETLIAPPEEPNGEGTLVLVPPFEIKPISEEVSEVKAEADITEELITGQDKADSDQTIVAEIPSELEPELPPERSTEPVELALSEETIISAPKVGETPAEGEAAEEIPDWLKAMMGESTDEVSVETANLEISTTEPEFFEETIVARSMKADEEIGIDASVADSGLMNEDDALALLAALADKHAGEAGWLESVVEETMGEDASVFAEDQVKAPAKPADLAFTAPETPIEISEEPAPEETIAWLESIAETQEILAKPEPIEEPLTLTPPEAQIEPPAWVTQGVIEEEETIVVVPTSDEVPDWLSTPSEEELGITQITPKLEETQIPEVKQAKIDLNTASLRELEDLPGVGFIMAQSILYYRQMHGPIESMEDLANIPGMAQPDIEALRDFVVIRVEKPQLTMVTRPLGEPQGEIDTALSEARQFVEANDLSGASVQYASLVKEGRYLPEIIRDLQQILERFPQDLNLWQTLGDACMRNDQLQEAMEAYTQAEELLR